MIKPVIMTNKPVTIKTEGIKFSLQNQRPVESLRKHADGMMKIRGVALRTPWKVEEKNIQVKQTLSVFKYRKKWAGCFHMTYIQLQNNSQTVKGQRYRRARGNNEQRYGHMFNFWKIPPADDVGNHLRR